MNHSGAQFVENCEKDAGLKAELAHLGLRQCEFAKLLDVSPRTVNMWAVGDVGLPGPVEGYLRLLNLMSPEERAEEFNRLPGRSKMFDPGMYRFQYCAHVSGVLDTGQGVCVLSDGKIFGCDPWGGVFHGSYMFNPAHERTDAQMVLRVPADGMLVTGLDVGHEGADFETYGSFERTDRVSKSIIKIAGVPVEVVLTYLGPPPS